MMRFEVFCPEIANRETRTVNVPDDVTEKGRLILPAGEYVLDEWYCEERDCDCRRVMFNVISRQPLAHVATINRAFDFPKDEIDRMVGQTFLDPLNPQSKWSEAFLSLVQTVVLADKAYLARLERHYHLFKQALVDPTNPGQRLLASAKSGELEPGPAQKIRPASKRRTPIPPPPPRGKRKWR